MIEIDPPIANLNLEPIGIDPNEKMSKTEYLPINEKVELYVPTMPDMFDLAEAYAKKLESKMNTAEESAFDAELQLANAQRIANHKRAEALRLRQQLEQLNKQIETMANAIREPRMTVLEEFEQAQRELQKRTDEMTETLKQETE